MSGVAADIGDGVMTAGALEDAAWLVESCRAPLLRDIGAFAAAELLVPDGPWKGYRYSLDRQPFVRKFFEAVMSGLWTVFVFLGPSQIGKTYTSWTIPLLWVLFEVEESAICGVPDLNMVNDKWLDDILPAIEHSRYRKYLPKKGPGSRGGKVTTNVTFGNGVSIRFMVMGGSDKSRAGKSTRYLFVTEMDAFDTMSDASDESSKLNQLLARTRAYGRDARIFLECTLTTEEAATWTKYSNGTASRLAMPCPHCGDHVQMGREDLKGWQDAPDVVTAMESAAYVCPSCETAWTEGERRTAAMDAVLVHRGQEVVSGGAMTVDREECEGKKGKRKAKRKRRAKKSTVAGPVVVGEMPRTDTLGFRVMAPDNLLLEAADVARDEWNAARSPDEDAADRQMKQFVWGEPVPSDVLEDDSVHAGDVMLRLATTARGVVPDAAEFLAVGVDIGKHRFHWGVGGIDASAGGVVVDYGTQMAYGATMGEEKGVESGLEEFGEYIMGGYSGGRVPDIVTIDAGWQTNVVADFCARMNRDIGHAVFFPSMGFGASERMNPGRYAGVPKSMRRNRRKYPWIGDGAHLERDSGWTSRGSGKCMGFRFDADHWKSHVWARFKTPIEDGVPAPGAMLLFAGASQEHKTFVGHLTAERRVMVYEPGKGEVVKWERIARRQNHWLDAMVLVCLGASRLGSRPTGTTGFG